jgi:hypothetical protein
MHFLGSFTYRIFPQMYVPLQSPYTDKRSFAGLKRMGCVADYSSQSNAEVRLYWPNGPPRILLSVTLHNRNEQCRLAHVQARGFNPSLHFVPYMIQYTYFHIFFKEMVLPLHCWGVTDMIHCNGRH